MYMCVYRGGEEWKNTKTFSAQLGEEQDVTRQMQLARLAFCHVYGLLAGDVASLELKTHALNALVRSVLLYGCGTLGLTASLIEKQSCALHIVDTFGY